MTSSLSEPSPTPAAKTNRWRLLLSALLAALALGYVLWGLDWQAFAASLAGIDYPAFFGLMAVLSVLVLSADALAIQRLLSRNIGPVSFRDVFVLRGASYLPSVVNYHLGQAWLTWVLSRAQRAPVWRVAGITLLSYASMFASMLLLGAVSFVLMPAAFPWLGPVLGSVFVLGVAYFLLLHFGRSWLGHMPPTRVLSEAGVSGHFAALAARVPHATALLLASWLPFRSFGVVIPFADALSLVPILVLVAALPLTPQGVGTREVTAIHLLAPYAAGTPAERAASITACCLAWVITATLFEGILSLACAPVARRLIARQDGA